MDIKFSQFKHSCLVLFSAIRRLTHDYKQLMPTQDDLQGAAMALVRLQETYRINMSDFSRGDVMGMPQGTSLTGMIVCPLTYMVNNF